MEKQFVSYELALKLKELGFIEECFGWYGRKDKLFTLIKEESFISNTRFIKLGDRVNHICSAPLWQQAFDWLLWKLKHISISIDYSCAGYELIVEKEKITDYHTKEECLEKLIELCEKK